MKYDFDTVVDRRGTYCTQWDYTKDRFGSSDVLPFSISDMDFPLPNKAINFLQKELASGIYGYTRWRNELLLDAIKGWYLKRFGHKIDTNLIMYSPTVIYSLSEIIRMKSPKNKNIFMFTPAYDAFFKVVEENDCNLYCSELVRTNDKYIINKDDFEQKIKKCSTFIFCSPHNPIGKFWTIEELEYIISICKKNNVFIISDEIHMDISYGATHYPLTKVAERLNYRDTCIITSATKAFNFPGLLFSYVLFTNSEDLNEFEMCLKNRNGLSSCTILGMKATAYAYNHLDGWIDELNKYIYKNYLYIKNYIKENDLKLRVTDQDGTYLIWIDASYYDVDKLLNIMYTQTKVGIMSGEVYGVHGYLRINIGCPHLKLEAGMRRLKAAIDIYNKENNDR